MEAKYENSVLSRLEILNGIIAITENLAFNREERINGIKVIVERKDGTTITEYLREDETEKIAKDYIAKKNELPPYVLTEETLKAIVEYVKAELQAK